MIVPFGFNFSLKLTETQLLPLREAIKRQTFLECKVMEGFIGKKVKIICTVYLAL